MFANRYLSSYQEAQGVDSVPLSKDVDPNGVLRNAVPKVYHTADNEVMYFERVVSSGSRTSYRAIKPEGIRAGYLVEVQGGFCAVPIGKERYKFLLKLRSICVLDREVDSDQNNAWIDRAKAESSANSNPLKRSVGYGNNSDSDSDNEEINPKRAKTVADGLATDVAMITIRK
ncbi:hypothetical protein EIP86_001109 [Pleurotus ostreatoroseus]|nr:hypothetical protein EIP86_001109 [Pleurotus ostreatoroseus]